MTRRIAGCFEVACLTPCARRAIAAHGPVQVRGDEAEPAGWRRMPASGIIAG
jgi:hypothetical protein